MDTLSIFLKTLTYILIGTLVRVILPRLINTRKPKEDTQGIEYFDKKGFSWVFLVSTIVHTIIFAFFIAFPGDTKGIVFGVMYLGSVCIFWYLLSLSYGFWYILITPDRIEFRNHYGIKRVITKDNVLKVLETPMQ